MRRGVLLLLCISFLGACSNEKPTSQLCGYGPMVVVNGKEYLRIPEKKTFTLEKELGKIKEKIDAKYHPIENFSSNSLESGTKIYSVKNDNHYILAKTSDDKYLLFEEIK